MILSQEEELERLRQVDRSKMHLYDLKKIDWDAYKTRAVTEKFQEYVDSPRPLESSENFVNAFRRYDDTIPSDEVREIMWAFVKKNRQDVEEAQRITEEILRKRKTDAA